MLDDWRMGRLVDSRNPRNRESVPLRSFARPQHSTPRVSTLSHPANSSRQLVSSANRSPIPWLLSPRHVGCRHALRRSSCATPAQDEVSLSPIGHGIVADSFGVALHAGQPSLAAQNFNMPALSPTMTEGNIANWKIKEGTTDPLRHTQALEA